MPNTASIASAAEAANRAHVASARLLELLSGDPSTINFVAAHEALVAAILAHVCFADTARSLMQRLVPPGDRMHKVLHGHLARRSE